MIVWIAMWLGCAEPAPEITCPEKAELKVSEPLVGGRKLWCERKNGTRHGPIREYRDDGTLWREGEFVNNRRQGTFTTYWPNGARKAEEPYVDGKIDGVVRHYDASGALVAEETWVKGRRAAAAAP